MDVFNGSLKELRAWAGVGPPNKSKDIPPPPKVPEHAERRDELDQLENYISTRKAQLL